MTIKVKEKRTSERFTIHSLVKFSCIGSDDMLDGSLLNCSEDGICFASRFEIQPGTAVFISEAENSKYFRAEVMWCKKTDDTETDSFVIGARYSD